MVTHTSICDVTVGHNTTTLLLNSLFEICLVKFVKDKKIIWFSFCFN